jgi:hypothetical protein
VQEPSTVLAEITRAAVDVLPDVDHAGVTLVRRAGSGTRPAELQSTAATGAIPELVDRLQHETGEGPCLDAVWQQDTMSISDMGTETRWARFVAAVLDRTPVRASLSIQLFVTDVELGALNLYSESADPFDPAEVDLGINLATHAAIALSGARRGTQFRSALASRDIIGQAKGIIMERFDVDALQAFDLLRRLSQDSNTPVAEVAAQLVDKDHPDPR